MARLRAEERAYIVKLFVRNCYVLEFRSNRQFDEFARPIIGYNLTRKYSGVFSGDCFERFLIEEDSSIVIPLIDELLEFALVVDEFFRVWNDSLIQKCRSIIEKYMDEKSVASANFNSKYMKSVEEKMKKYIKDDPTNAIGRAKDYIEDCCKTILDLENIKYKKTSDINDLVKLTLEFLNLVPESVCGAEKCGDNIKAVLGNMKTIPVKLAEIRNGYGSGHGKGEGFVALEPRHARLAVNCAITFVSFVWETYEKQKNDKIEN